MPRQSKKKNKEKKAIQEIPQRASNETSDLSFESKKSFFIATGKRKTAVAQVKFYPEGKNEILINQRPLEKYFPYFVWQDLVRAPFSLLGLKNYKIIVKINGGGLVAQAEAIRLGISRALLKMNQDYKSILKKAKFLTRDARVKERKKPGLKRARRAPQWQKR